MLKSTIICVEILWFTIFCNGLSCSVLWEEVTTYKVMVDPDATSVDNQWFVVHNHFIKVRLWLIITVLHLLTAGEAQLGLMTNE